jgi:Tfp pilus assembly protein PilV
LFEALIAMAIFSIGFMAVGKMVIFTSTNNTRSNIMTQATLLASKKLEELKNTPDITDLPSDLTTFDDENNPMDEDGQNGGIFSRSWTIHDPVAYDSARQIEVTVSWTRRGRQRSVVLTTITRGRGT